VVTSKQGARETNATTQASSPKDLQAHDYGGHKAWQNQGLEREIRT